jgi:hypothetical protein
MTGVFIPSSNRKVFQEGSHNILPEIDDWMDEHVGPYGHEWNCPFRWSGVEVGHGIAIGCDFTFKDPAKALLFKLTWAGK